MAQIEDLISLDLDKIEIDLLRQAIQELLEDYEKEEDKASFQKAASKNTDMLYEMVKKRAPEALPAPARKAEIERSEKEKAQAEEEKKEEAKKRKEKSKKAIDEVNELDTEIEACRQVIREYNQKKKKAEGKEPVKKTRLTKLKEKLLGIAALIPENLKEDKSVRDKTEKILLNTLSDLKKAWGMNVIKQAQEAIKEKFDKLEEKHGGEEKQA